MIVANTVARLLCMLLCSCAAWRLQHSKLSTKVLAPGQGIQVQDTCDPSTTILKVGDAYTVRSFMAKDLFGKSVGQFVNYVTGMGHQYIEIVARDASAENVPAKSCLVTFGLFIWEEDVDIQSPDWGVAVNSKKIANCMNDGSTLAACVNEMNDIMDPPLELDSPHSPTRTFVARGTEQYGGKLSDIQIELLSLVTKQANPSTHEFLGKPVVKMSVRKGCQPGMAKPLMAPRAFFGWQCNCMTFANRFREDTANLLSDLRHLVTLLKSMEAPPTEDLTALFGDSGVIQRRDVSYKCCCTELNWTTFCKLAAKNTLTRGGCGGLDELNVQFHSWNNMPKKSGSVTIENFGRCMVALQDPLLSHVRNTD